MPRKLRLEYEGAIHHVMNRGDRRESIFLGEEDRQLFVETLGEACQKTGWQVHAYGLNRPGRAGTGGDCGVAGAGGRGNSGRSCWSGLGSNKADSITGRN